MKVIFSCHFFALLQAFAEVQPAKMTMPPALTDTTAIKLVEYPQKNQKFDENRPKERETRIKAAEMRKHARGKENCERFGKLL